ncbi:MAG: amidohydrolase family protein [Acidimicrobiales bacterium]|jgi:cytosine deaminase
MAYELVVKRAQLRGAPQLSDIGISGGKIAAVADELPTDAAEVIDAAGRLVVPGFIDCHFHIGKSFFGRETHRYDYRRAEWNPSDLGERYRHRYRSGMADLEEYHENVVPLVKQWAWKEAYTPETVADRICEALSLGLSNGVVACRMFVDVDSFARLVELEGALEAKRRVGHLIQLQVCPFPQEGLDADPETAGLMEQAMKMGADVVGGLPHVEWTEQMCHDHADFCFELADRYGAPVHFLCDDVASPMSRTLEYVAAKTVQARRYGRVSSSHNGALSSYPDTHAVKVLNMIRDAEMNICCNSHVNLLGALTRVHEMVDYGINVSVGQDDLDNFYYPFGQEDPLEWAWSLAHAGQFAYPRGIEQVFDMVTVNGAKTLGLSGYGLEVGCRADLVVLDCTHPREAIQYRSDRLHVISNGRRVAGTKRERWLAEPAHIGPRDSRS